MSSLSDFLTRIANSIRKVKGTNAQINAQNFPAEIEKMAKNNGLQWKCDNVKSLIYEFKGYTGTSLDDVLTGLDTSNVVNMNSTFESCTNLKSIPKLNTSNVVNMDYMFYECNKLITIPELDMNKANFSSSLVKGCTNLTNLQLKNVNVNLQIGSGTSWGHLLTIDSLLSACRAMASSKKLTVGTANLEKLASVYVNSDGYQVEEGTDGAITVSQYMANKSCTLA